MVVFNQIIHRIKVDQIHTMMDIIVEMEDTTAIQVVFNALRHICLQILITLQELEVGGSLNAETVVGTYSKIIVIAFI